MNADPSIVLEARCPEPDDPAVEDFLRLAANVCGVTSIELQLIPEGIAPPRRYSIGPGNEMSTIFELCAGRGYRAEIRAAPTQTPPPDAVAVLESSLRQLLETRDLRVETALLRGVINTSSSAALVFDGHGEIIFANPPADLLLSLQTEDELTAETKGEPSQPLFTLLCSLVDRVRDATDEKSGWNGTLYLADGRFLACEVSWLDTPPDFVSNAVLVIMRPIGSGSKARVESFAARFELSPRQREVVQLLVDGLNTVAMADALGISPHTVRDHLKHLYRKTGSNSRSELLGLVSRAAPSKVGTST